MSSHAALTVSPRERARVANPSAPRAAIAPHKRIEPARRTGGNYGAACRASNANIGSNSLTPYSWTLAARGGEAPAPAGAAVAQERPICLDFAQRGASVAFNYVELAGRDVSAQALLTETALKGCGVRVYSARCDVRNHDDVEQFMTQVKERLGGVHCLVNNAGVTHDGALWRLPPDAWREVMETNVTGAFNCIQAAAPTMRAQRYGKIVNIASHQAFRPGFGIANYAASKAALIGLTKSAAVDLGPSTINGNAVAPGFVTTEQQG